MGESPADHGVAQSVAAITAELMAYAADAIELFDAQMKHLAGAFTLIAPHGRTSLELPPSRQRARRRTRETVAPDTPSRPAMTRAVRRCSRRSMIWPCTDDRSDQR